MLNYVLQLEAYYDCLSVCVAKHSLTYRWFSTFSHWKQLPAAVGNKVDKSGDTKPKW